MRRPLVAAILVGCLLQMAVKSITTLTCNSTETMVRPPFEYENGVQCKDVIGRAPDLGKDIYLKTCQRWLGLSEKPKSINNCYVDQCTDLGNGTVRYTSKVCCPGVTTEQRCFTCSNADNTYECTHGGEVVTCAEDEVCMTQSKNYPRNGESIGYRSAECNKSSECLEFEGNNDYSCPEHAYKESPECYKCCSGPFCNYMEPDIKRWYYDDVCKEEPCLNGGTCVLNGIMSNGYECKCVDNYIGTYCEKPKDEVTCYNNATEGTLDGNKHCFCLAPYTGDKCDQDAPLCSSSVCENGATCYDHSAVENVGLLCKCTEGWYGKKCDKKPQLQCRDQSTFLNPDIQIGTFNYLLHEYTCEYIGSKVFSRRKSMMLNGCLNSMQRPGVERFIEGVHGSVGKVESYAVSKCTFGEGTVDMAFHVCCPSCYSNPCQNNGWCYQNSDWDYVCQCRYGFVGRNCQNIRINMCIISGDPHYKTIDGKMIHFQGQCKYNLLSRSQENNGIPDFKVFGRNERRGDNSRVSYPSYFEIHYLSYVIKLKKAGVVTVNDEVVYPDRNYPPHFKITKNGLFTRFQSVDGLIVDFDGSWFGLIVVTESYNGKVDGLCGNFDDDPSNDMMTSSKMESSSHAEIGNSWQVDDPDDPECLGPTEDNAPDCNTTMENLVQSNEYCGLLQDKSGIFGTCLLISGELAEKFYESCKYDVCANPSAAKEAACASLATFAVYCQSMEGAFSWRNTAKCSVKCPEGMTYKESAPACAATCETPDGPETCSYPDNENCICPDDMVVINGTCHKPEECKCPGGHEIGSTWLSTNCSKLYSCEPCKDCVKRKVARVYESDYSCGENEVCQLVDGFGKCQSCTADGGWSSWSSWSKCNSTTLTQTRQRSCTNPPPSCGGKPCEGDEEESQECTVCEPDCEKNCAESNTFRYAILLCLFATNAFGRF